MAKIIAVANQKGGVGKTTSCVNLCAALHTMGRRVLLVDCDPQGNASSGMGVPKASRPNTYDILINETAAVDCIRHTDYGDVIPTGKELAAASVELIGTDKREFVLKSALMTLFADYDYIFIDCPPSLGLITINCLCAADTVLIPIQCEYYALEGLSQLISSIRQIKRLYNPTLDIEGILLTMYDGRLNLTHQVVSEVKNFFPGKVFKTSIPRAVRISEAPSFGQPIMYYDKSSKGAKAYCDLAKELVKRNKKFKQ